jgi:fatty acid synthase subunit alpha
MKNNADELHVR